MGWGMNCGGWAVAEKRFHYHSFFFLLLCDLGVRRRTKIRSLEKGLADGGGWREEILPMPHVQASFMHPFFQFPPNEGRRTQFWEPSCAVFSALLSGFSQRGLANGVSPFFFSENKTEKKTEENGKKTERKREKKRKETEKNGRKRKKKTKKTRKENKEKTEKKGRKSNRKKTEKKTEKKNGKKKSEATPFRRPLLRNPDANRQPRDPGFPLERDPGFPLENTKSPRPENPRQLLKHHNLAHPSLS